MRLNTLIALVFGAVLAVLGCGLWSWSEHVDRFAELMAWWRSSGYQSESGRIRGPGYGVGDGGFFYAGMWRVSPEPTALAHIVFFPKCVEYGLGASASLGSWGTSPIQSTPEGLYVDGVPVRLGPERRVFVYTAKRRMRPVPLTAEQLKALMPDAMERLTETDAWPVILAVLDEEEWCCGCEAPPEPVQAPKPAGSSPNADGRRRRPRGRGPG